MLKYFICVTILLCCFNPAKSQSLTVKDIIQVTNLSHEQATQYLVSAKHFKLISSATAYGQTISQYSKENGNIMEFVSKAELKDGNKMVPSVHYDVTPAAYAQIIVSQLKQSGFKLKTKQGDNSKQISLYANDKYTVSINVFASNKLPASIEIHSK